MSSNEDVNIALCKKIVLLELELDNSKKQIEEQNQKIHLLRSQIEEERKAKKLIKESREHDYKYWKDACNEKTKSLEEKHFLFQKKALTSSMLKGGLFAIGLILIFYTLTLSYYNPSNVIDKELYYQLKKTHLTSVVKIKADLDNCNETRKKYFEILSPHIIEPEWSKIKGQLQPQPIWLNNQKYYEYVEHFNFDKEMGDEMLRKHYKDFLNSIKME